MKILGALLLCIASGCSSSYLTRTARMMSPEAEGQYGISTEVGLHEVQRVYITGDIASIPVNQDLHGMVTDITGGATGTFGLLDFLDVGVNYDIVTAPMLFTKVQLLGDPRRVATAGNTSIAVYASVGYDSGSVQTATDDSIFGSSSTTGSINLNGHGIYEAGAIFGYRLSSHVLLIGGGSVLWQEISGSQTLSSSDTPVLFDDHSRFTEFHVGSTINFHDNDQRGFFLTPVVQWGYIDTFGNRDYGTTIQANFGYQFN